MISDWFYNLTHRSKRVTINIPEILEARLCKYCKEPFPVQNNAIGYHEDWCKTLDRNCLS